MSVPQPGPPSAAVALPPMAADMVCGLLFELRSSAIDAALLHPRDDFRPDHDVDLAVAGDVGKIDEITVRYLAGLGFVRVLTSEYGIRSHCIVFVRLHGGQLERLAIDLSNDLGGFGAEGVPMRRVLADARGGDGVRCATPAWEQVYLISKRTGKGQWRDLYGPSPQDAGRFEGTPFLECATTVFGRSWARRLADRKQGQLVESAQEARRLKRAVLLRRLLRSPRIPVIETLRLARRIARPNGVYLVLGGPDGSGKSSLADSFQTEGAQVFRRTVRMHWRPGLLPFPGRAGRPSPDRAHPHSVHQDGTLSSTVRLLYYWLDHLLGYWLKIRPVCVRSGLVIMERGYFDMLVDPKRYGLRVPEAVVRLLGRLLPAPTAVLVLTGDPAVFRARKPELPEGEIDRQVQKWKELARRSKGMRLVEADRADQDVGRFARQVFLEAVDERGRAH